MLARENQGNALLTGAGGDTVAFLSDFDLIHAVAWIRYDTGRFPVSVGGQYVANSSAADAFDDDGFSFGAELGRLEGAGTWRVHYQYQELGREAVFSPFAQDDFLDGTNFRGHLAGIAVGVFPRGTVYLWTLWSAGAEPQLDRLQKRCRLDVNVTF